MRMSKKAWFVILLIAIPVAYLGASRLYPPLDAWTSTNLIIPAQNWLIGAVATIQANPFVQQYIGWIGLVFGFFVGILMYDMFSKKKIPLTKTALPKAPYQHAPTSTPQQVPQQVDINITTDKDKVEEKT